MRWPLLRLARPSVASQLLMGMLLAGSAGAQGVPGGAAESGGTAASGPAAAAPAPALRWMSVPRVSGRLRVADIGLVINTADAYSVEVGEHYIRSRGLQPAQVLRVELPLAAVLTLPEFERLQQAITAHFGAATQALALAWSAPYAVACQSITGALALGFDPGLCKLSCAPSRPSPYFNSRSHQPWADHALRPSMLLAARTAEQARAMIDRGVASDGSLAQAGRLPVTAQFLSTGDAARGVRMRLYPPAGELLQFGLQVTLAPAEQLPRARRVVLALTGSVRLPLSPAPDWVAGGLGDHLTSFGGQLFGAHGQDTVLDWIESGATASHGAVSEPCNHLQKFPHPQALLLHYLQGSSALEAYWKSVAWPQQSLFVGEPLAAPFAPVMPSAPASPPSSPSSSSPP